MVSPLLNPTACWEFEGEILVLHHPTTISTRYQAMGMSNHLFLIQLTIYTRPYGKRGGGSHVWRWVLYLRHDGSGLENKQTKEYDPPVGRVAAIVLNLNIYEKYT